MRTEKVSYFPLSSESHTVCVTSGKAHNKYWLHFLICIKKARIGNSWIIPPYLFSVNVLATIQLGHISFNIQVLQATFDKVNFLLSWGFSAQVITKQPKNGHKAYEQSFSSFISDHLPRNLRDSFARSSLGLLSLISTIIAHHCH